jgi:hypothetical protein
MPVEAVLPGGTARKLTPTESWQTATLDAGAAGELELDPDYYAEARQAGTEPGR